MLRETLKNVTHKCLGKLGYRISKIGPPPTVAQRYPDIEEGFFGNVHERCKNYTLTPAARLYALHQAVSYVVASGVPGDFVECGVWKGGSAMAAALTLKELGDTQRNLYLYDTFSGMSEPTAKDVDFQDQPAMPQWQEMAKEDVNEWCYASLEEVAANLKSTGYPMDRVQLIQGEVEETIPRVIPREIALLRLDTDWYESTYHELRHLFPRLVQRGVLIIDDYGYWKGAREATDEFLAENGIHLLLNRIDATCRVGVKTD